MSAALTAYLERLVHPARKAYATAYAEHVLTDSAKPSRPKSIDAETATKIQRKVTRYAKQSTVDTKASEATPTLADLAETLRAYAADRNDPELAELVNVFTQPEVTTPPADAGVSEHEWTADDWAGYEQQAEIEHHAHVQSERISDYYTPERTVAMIESAEVDVLDLTGLEPELARALALKLSRWNGGGKVYNYRAGRRYLNGRIRAIDLDDETVRSLPNYDDLRAGVSERGVRA